MEIIYLHCNSLAVFSYFHTQKKAIYAPNISLLFCFGNFEHSEIPMGCICAKELRICSVKKVHCSRFFPYLQHIGRWSYYLFSIICNTDRVNACNNLMCIKCIYFQRCIRKTKGLQWLGGSVVRNLKVSRLEVLDLDRSGFQNGGSNHSCSQSSSVHDVQFSVHAQYDSVHEH